MPGESAVPRGKTRTGRRRGGAAVTITITAGLALVACSSGGGSSAGGTSSTTAAARTAACPTGAASDQAGAPSGTPTGMPSGNLGGLPVAKTIKKSDTSTSVVINPTGAQIQCATTGITTTNDIT